MIPIAFRLIGAEPKPKGSMQPVPRRKFPFTIYAFGDLYKCIAIVNDSSKTAKWEREVARAARLAMDGRPPLAGGVILELVFHLPAPAKIPVERDGLPIGRGTGDLDKLTRSFLDALSGIAYLDDIQVVKFTVEKRYAQKPSDIGVQATITVAAGVTPNLFADQPLSGEEPPHGHRQRRARKSASVDLAASVNW